MSDAFSIQSVSTTWPLMSRPMMSLAFCSASAGSSASLTPPAFPRPPVSTWALTTTCPPSSCAAARASSGVRATRPSETGIPNCAKSCLPWYSKRSIGRAADYRRDSGLRGFDRHDRVSDRDRLQRRNGELGDRARDDGGHLVLHLHRLDHANHLTGLDRVAGGDL